MTTRSLPTQEGGRHVFCNIRDERLIQAECYSVTDWEIDQNSAASVRVGHGYFASILAELDVKKVVQANG
ncbi:unnamed protein product [Protopolystoma xenopodis]|uniref:Uncharacterized protein n=1 Tax=Protopolystoma xenopodis TaxID=117903 RepID=A0A3S5CHI8_9PLAT|nr:unnamed protein product [Protopolystoma xenopodis]